MDPQVLSIIGGVSGLLSILAIVYVWGVKLGNIETTLKNLQEQMISPKEYGEMHGKVGTLYDLFVMRQERAPQAGNPHPIKPNNPGPPEDLSPLPEDIRLVADEVAAENRDKSVEEVASLVLQDIGSQEGNLVNVLMEAKLGVGEFIDLLLAYVVQIRKGTTPTESQMEAED